MTAPSTQERLREDLTDVLGDARELAGTAFELAREQAAEAGLTARELAARVSETAQEMVEQIRPEHTTRWQRLRRRAPGMLLGMALLGGLVYGARRWMGGSGMSTPISSAGQVSEDAEGPDARRTSS